MAATPLFSKTSGALGLLLGLIILAGAALRVVAWQEPVNSDDMSYYQLASGFDSFLDQADNPNALRLPLLGLASIPGRLAGYSIQGFYGVVALFALVGLAGVLVFYRTFATAGELLLLALLWATSYSFILVDGRLIPDNLGTGFAFLGLGLLGRAAGVFRGRTTRPLPEGGSRRAAAMAFAAGFSLWLAIAVRVSFVPYALIALIGVWIFFREGRREPSASGLSGERSARFWPPLFWPLIAGGAVGALLELLLFQLFFGDPLTRVRAILDYGGGLSDNPFFQGHDWISFLTRYPRMFWNTGSAEIFWFLLGLLGVAFWIRDRKNPLSRFKAWALIFAFGFLALAVSRLDPPAPILREKIRYYVTVLPLIHLGVVATLSGLIGWGRRLHPGVGGLFWVGAAAGVVALTGLNLWVVDQFKYLGRNGHDANVALSAAIAEHNAATSTPRVVYSGGKAVRILRLYLTEADGWRFRPGGAGFDEAGYLALDWRTLNAYARQPQYLRAQAELAPDTLIERFPVLLRHESHGRLTDLHRVGPHPIERSYADVTGAFTERTLLSAPGGLGGPGGQGTNQTVAPGQVVWVEPDWTLRLEGGASLPAHRFLLVAVTARDPALAEREFGPMLTVRLSGRAVEGEALRHLNMGPVHSDAQPRETILWSWLERPVAAPALEMTGGVSPILVEDLRVTLLEPHPEDRTDRLGGAWR